MITSETNKIRQFRCKNCGGEIQLQNRRTQYVACQYCGSVSDADSEAGKILTKMADPADYPSMSFIKLGMEGTFNGKLHHVIGRTRRQNTYKEYWEEDGEAGYSDEVWIFDEWLLISEDGTYFTIVEDEERYYFVAPVIPLYPSLPQGQRMQDFFKKNKEHRVTEYGETQIMYYEGESTYLVQAGLKSEFAQYESGRSSYSAEWRYEEGNEIKEIEFFEETTIPVKKLKEAFGITKKVGSKSKKTEARKGIKNRYIILVAGILNLLIGLLASSGVETSEVFNKKILVNKEAETTGWQNVNDTLHGITFQQPISLKPDSKILNVRMFANLPESSEALLELVFLDKNKDTLFYSYEYGYNYIYSEKLEAVHIPNLSNNYKIDNSIRNFDMQFTIKVPKKWKKIGDDIKAELVLKESNKTSIDKKEQTIGLGALLIFLGIGIIIVKRFRNN